MLAKVIRYVDYERQYQDVLKQLDTMQEVEYKLKKQAVEWIESLQNKDNELIRLRFTNCILCVGDYMYFIVCYMRREQLSDTQSQLSKAEMELSVRTTVTPVNPALVHSVDTKDTYSEVIEEWKSKYQRLVCTCCNQYIIINYCYFVHSKVASSKLKEDRLLEEVNIHQDDLMKERQNHLETLRELTSVKFRLRELERYVC